ncbi:hypothetical protein RAS12_00675 [Achromobacter seleniivolatilans]|uniref:Lysozyme n=1 Tax=Achromobacter seleniivolatilans TaxID=3047478 RepID=A0ABY9M1N9_9BURK|nr:hypothetical protein [Achromobacter sp. R39]WMD20918.1 hypothetical protein RAS12_00675 [Achromobacter sp. R39]
MDLNNITKTAIDPALALLPAKMDSAAARVMLLAIGLQESRFVHRRQIGGPARGFWQFERGGGVRGVLTHAASRDQAKHICGMRRVDPIASAVYDALESDDVLAAAFARLLLWTDLARLPAVGDAQGGWNLYARTWRPGKPHLHTWPALYAEAAASAGGSYVGLA